MGEGRGADSEQSCTHTHTHTHTHRGADSEQSCTHTHTHPPTQDDLYPSAAPSSAAPPYPPNPGPHRPPAPHAAVPEVRGAGKVVARRGAVEGRRGPAPEAGTPPGPAPFWVGTTVGLGGGAEPIRAVSLRPLPDTLAASCWCRSLCSPCPVWRSRAGGRDGSLPFCPHGERWESE